MSVLWPAAILWYVAWSVAAFGVYAWDKAMAARGGRRVPERRLHALSCIGGFPGAAAAMVLLRHKTRKGVFAGVLVLAFGLHASVWLVVCGLLWRVSGG